MHNSFYNKRIKYLQNNRYTGNYFFLPLETNYTKTNWNIEIHFE